MPPLNIDNQIYQIASLCAAEQQYIADAQKIATESIALDPQSMTAITQSRWEMALRAGVVHFNPKDPQNYKLQHIGPFWKRIIPDRLLPAPAEIMSNQPQPVYLPFIVKLSDFDFTRSTYAQNLYDLQLESGNYHVYASNSPLTNAPHTLLVPEDLRPQFLLASDVAAICEISELHPEYSFTYSSVGAGAGVNHQHLHMIVGNEYYPVLTQPTIPIPGAKSEYVTLSEYDRWPTDSIVLSGNPKACRDFTTAIIQLFQALNIPHNIFYSNYKYWINPRSRITNNIFPGKKYGTWETILGICNSCSWSEYQDVTFERFLQAVSDIKLTDNERQEIINSIINLSRQF